MKEYDSNIIETIERLIYDYMRYNKGVKPKSIFISKNMVDLLKAQCRLVMRKVDEKVEPTLCGLKVYEVLQDGVIKVTD